MRELLRKLFALAGVGRADDFEGKYLSDFDEVFYLEKNPDVAASKLNPKVHYLRHGRKEGRPGNAEVYIRKFCDPDFDPNWYLQHHPDIAEAGIDPSRHFLEHGRAEGRVGSPGAERLRQDARLQNSPVEHVDDHHAAYYVSTPAVEARPAARAAKGPRLSRHIKFDSNGHIIRASPQFDIAAYLEDNPDVAAAIPNTSASLMTHWLEHGFFENRTAFGVSPYSERSLTRAVWRKKPAITCYGLFDAPSGLGVAARLYRDAFVKAGFDVRTVTVTEQNGRFLTKPETRKTHSDADAFDEHRVNFYILNADMMDIFFLDERRHLLDDSYNIAVWYWELAYFPSKWLRAFGPLDEVWVASEFCRKSISALSPVPVHVIPPPVAEPISGVPFSRKHFGIPDKAFVFGSIFDVGSTLERKNPYALVKSFRRAFGDRDDVCLALKYHGAHHYPEAIKKLHFLAAGASNIRFFGTVMDDGEIASFRASLDCFVSPHRSEGFGFNVAESLMLEKPVIATKYSGSADFLRMETGFPVDFKLVEVGKQLGPYPAYALWADPDLDDISKSMLDVFKDPDGAGERARRGREYVLKEYSVDACARRIQAQFDAIGIFASEPAEISAWGDSRHVAMQKLPSGPPCFTIIATVMDTPAGMLVDCANSVLDQSYPDWELIFVDVGSRSKATLTALSGLLSHDARIRVVSGHSGGTFADQINTAIEISAGDFLMLTEAENTLSETALEELRSSTRAHTQTDLIYVDEARSDVVDHTGKPNFKPDWSPDYLESSMYMSDLIVIRRDHLVGIGGVRNGFEKAWLYDLALRAARDARFVLHVPKILYRLRRPGKSVVGMDEDAIPAARLALVDHLEASGRDARVEDGLVLGSFRVRDNIPPGLPVTLLMFTNNGSAEVRKRGQINLFDNFLGSITTLTRTICDTRLLIVDNGNLSPEQCARVESAGGRVISYPGPKSPFNFPKKANFALGYVETEYVILLNDDMEIIEPGWVDALMEVAIRPSTGVVGAKLLFPDDHIQHCGVVFGIFEDAAHIFHGKPDAEIGYNGVTHLIRNYSAVTGACMATRMSLVRELGGFDEKLAIDYNDVDFCLRAQEIGYRNVFTPYAKLYHFEGKTAKRSVSTQADQQLFRERWAGIVARDPHYNANLSRRTIDFTPE